MLRMVPWLEPVLASLLLAGCAGPPASAPAAAPRPALAAPIVPTGVAASGPLPTPSRYLAFTACRRGHAAGSLFLWDAALQDVYVLNAALAGLVPAGKQVEGPSDCYQLAQLNPRAFGKGKVLFSYGSKVLVYDLLTEERVTAATDGRPLAKGGPEAVVSADGKLLAYVSVRGTLVLKPTHPVYATKTRELSKIAAEVAALGGRKAASGVIEDFDLSADGKWLVLNVDGAVYLYDVTAPRLYQVAPLDGEALAGLGDGFGHVAIGPDGNLVACTIAGGRLLVFDRKQNRVDTVPYANLGDTAGGRTLVYDPLFGEDGRTLYFETLVGGTFKVWRYDLLNETLAVMAVLNNVLGEEADDVLVTEPALAPTASPEELGRGSRLD